MRFRRMAVGGFLMTLALVSVTAAQFRPGFGGANRTDPVVLLNDPQVRKELGISDEQAEKMPAAIFEAVTKVLDAKQVKRLREIQLQQMGSRALLDAKVQGDLKFTDSQKESVKTILDDAAKDITTLTKEFGKGGDFKGMGEKIAAIRKESNEKAMEVLNADQRRTYTSMLGEEFKFEAPKGFGKGGFGKGKDKGKTKDKDKE